VVSLLPSATESLLAWGVDVVACTRFCEQPALVHVGGTKDPDVAAIVALRPDLVVVDREENRREDAEALRAGGLAVHVTAVRSLADVEPTLRALAAAVDATFPPASIEPDEAAEADDVVAPNVDGRWASAFVPIWRRPWMTISGDTYGSTLLASLGVANAFADDDRPYPQVELDDVAARRPTLVLVPSEPYAFRDSHVAELQAAVPDAAVVRVDGQDLFWWGVRTPAARQRLRATLRAVRPPR
jgi:ABC-type Fe3+-hydroxamate transport system substrate-binding protein